MKYGWIPDKPDHRDLFYRPDAALKLVTLVDLRPLDTPIYNQGELGSCTANAISAHLDFNRKAQGEEIIAPSRLFIYYNERSLENTVDYDAGASIRDSVKVVKNQGAVPEHQWPYDVTQFKVQPPENLYQEAVNYEDLTYLRINQDIGHMKSRLAEHFPFVTGISVYESFESPEVARTGLVPIPKRSESLLGGHAVMVLGFDDSKQHFIVRNSWGNQWGAKGYFYLPYNYLTNPNLARDMWTLEKVK